MIAPPLLPVMKRFGEPVKHLSIPGGMLLLWESLPFLVTQFAGYATKDVVMEIDGFYRRYFSKTDDVVTIHEWSKLQDYDTDCRRVLQQLTYFMKGKQREIIIHLGPADSLGQRVIRTTAETIQRFRGMPTEIFCEDTAFQNRVRELFIKYHRDTYN